MSLKDSLFRKEALEFQRRRLLGDIIIAQPVRFSVITAVMTAILVATLLYLFFGTYSEKKTVRGSLVPSAGLIRVLAPSGSIVDRAFVVQGAVVNRGDPLVTLRRDVPGFDGQGRIEKIARKITAQEAELQQQLGLINQQFKARAEQIRVQIDNAKVEQSFLERAVRINREIAENSEENATRFGDAAERGFIAKQESRELKQQQLTAEGAVFSDQQRLANLAGQIDNLKVFLELLPLERDTQLSVIRQQMVELSSRRDELFAGNIQTLNAPVSGTISDVRAQVGRSTTPGEVLITMRGLEDPLVAELVIPTSIAGSTESGKSVRIFYDAFPYQRYGIFSGQIESVSESVYVQGSQIGSLLVNEAAYKAIVKLDVQSIEAFNRESPLQPGMELEANFVIANRRLIELFFKPLIEAFLRWTA